MARLGETPPTLYLFCLFAQTILVASVGLVLMYFSDCPAYGVLIVPFGVGMGMVAYAVAVTVYTLISIWHFRRARG